MWENVDFVRNFVWKNKNLKKIIVPIVVVVIIFVVGLMAYNVKVLKPKNTYNEAIELLDNGKYEEADELLNSIADYKDVATIKNQLKYELYVYSLSLIHI